MGSGPPEGLWGCSRWCPQALVTEVSLQATVLVFQALAHYEVSSPRQLELNLDVSVLLPRRASSITYRIENRNALVARSAEVPAPLSPLSLSPSGPWGCSAARPAAAVHGMSLSPLSLHVPGQSCPLAMASVVPVPSMSCPLCVLPRLGMSLPCPSMSQADLVPSFAVTWNVPVPFMSLHVL